MAQPMVFPDESLTAIFTLSFAKPNAESASRAIVSARGLRIVLLMALIIAARRSPEVVPILSLSVNPQHLGWFAGLGPDCVVTFVASLSGLRRLPPGRR